jgi:biotin-dependent carboxylase-like uncharacterized protein
VIDVLDPGFLTTVQDGGRRGWARYGVPPSGPLDRVAFAAANALVGNGADAAGLEISWVGPLLRFRRRALVAVCGGDFDLWVGTLRVPAWHALFVRAGQHLRLGERRRGARAYLAVDGGIDLPPFLGSRATYLPGGFGGFEGRALRAGDRLPLGSPTASPMLEAGRAWPHDRRPAYSDHPTLRVILGPQEDAFTREGLSTFLGADYVLTPASDRMGARLHGPSIEHAGRAGIVSDGLVTGCIQVPADGQPIVMLADHQTTGGYPKIATVLQADLPLLAQLLPGESVRFRAVSLEEAQAQDLLLRVCKAITSRWRNRGRSG